MWCILPTTDDEPHTMPKNIVLLSDGTGNSSAQLLKTNVWRVYETLDLDDPNEQVACYDDGVGTSSFKPLALLGGAFGVGLKKNVLRLYRFLCEHYDPGDRIYAFGFSRGAFTIRVLIGLVSHQGIIKTRPTSPAVEAYPDGDAKTATAAAHDVGTFIRGEPQVYGKELTRLSRWAYREFRRDIFTQTGALVSVARRVRDAVLHFVERALPRYDKRNNHQVEHIEFLGLWDTVDAYGLPADELTEGINQWVWPLSAPDLLLSKKVRKACHAVAIDDERNTFHPVLWDETDEPQDAAHVDEERISQVWFAGMHSNVGGGYPDDSLSFLSFRWITEEAAKRDVRFSQGLLSLQTKKADPFGRIYDSRSGLKGYYRYNPRRIEWLTNGQVHEAGFGGWPQPSPTVKIVRPKIHESVFARIAAAPEAYAPIIFPDRYAIVRADGTIVNGDKNPYESEEARRFRIRAQEAAWNIVWWRRVVYFTTVAVTFLFLARPLGVETGPLTEAERTIASRLLGLASALVPWGLSEPWVTYYSARPMELYGLGAAILALTKISSMLRLNIQGRMRGIWSQVVPPPGRNIDTVESPGGAVYRLRTHPYYQGSFAVLRHHVLPTVTGIGALVIGALCVLGLGNRAVFEVANVSGGVCAATAATARLTSNEPRTIEIVSTAENARSRLCASTGILMEQGADYELAAVVNAHDGSVAVTSPAGFTARSDSLTGVQRAVFVAAGPFRRVVSRDWYVPIARIGSTGFDHYPLPQHLNTFTARTSGELFVFVNDAILPFGPGGLGWSSYYANNLGTVTITIRKVRGNSP
jgi:hypothetical protein